MDFKTLTAPQKCMYLVLARLFTWTKRELPAFKSGAEVQELYETEAAADDGHFQDAREEVRQSGVQAHGIETPSSRHYEIDAQVDNLPGGVWVGWWYLHGGGKHSEPGSYDWVGNAFDVEAEPKVVTTTHYTFKKAEPAQDA